MPYKQDVRGSNPCVPTKASHLGGLFSLWSPFTYSIQVVLINST
jgi:hypothetical protein